MLVAQDGTNRSAEKTWCGARPEELAGFHKKGASLDKRRVEAGASLQALRPADLSRFGDAGSIGKARPNLFMQRLSRARRRPYLPTHVVRECYLGSMNLLSLLEEACGPLRWIFGVAGNMASGSFSLCAQSSVWSDAC